MKSSRVSSPSKGSSKNSPFSGGNSQLMEMNSLLPGSGNASGKGERASAGAVRAREFQLSSVRFIQELGEGAFGKLSDLLAFYIFAYIYVDNNVCPYKASKLLL